MGQGLVLGRQQLNDAATGHMIQLGKHLITMDTVPLRRVKQELGSFAVTQAWYRGTIERACWAQAQQFFARVCSRFLLSMFLQYAAAPTMHALFVQNSLSCARPVGVCIASSASSLCSA